MVRRNVPLERKLIEQRGLFDLTMSHHDLQSCLLQRLNQRTSCVATEDFFNKIGQLETSLFCAKEYYVSFLGEPHPDEPGAGQLAIPCAHIRDGKRYAGTVPGGSEIVRGARTRV